MGTEQLSGSKILRGDVYIVSQKRFAVIQLYRVPRTGFGCGRAAAISADGNTGGTRSGALLHIMQFMNQGMNHTLQSFAKGQEGAFLVPVCVSTGLRPVVIPRMRLPYWRSTSPNWGRSPVG